jgi:hypothetical protein
VTVYEVYTTRFDDPHVVNQIPNPSGLFFTLPLSDHGEASFTATSEPGKAFWRQALALPSSGVLIARDGVPVWGGWVTGERPTGPRSTSYTCKEWGHFFEEKVPALPRTWTQVNDHQIFRDLVNDAQAISGQNLQIQIDGSTTGAAVSDRTINAWDETTTGREFRSVGDAEGGPEWYFDTAGTLATPVRQLVLGDRLGHTSPQTTLEYVEDTVDYEPPGPPPMVVLYGDLFLAGPQLVPVRRAGGNVIAQGRTRDVAEAATVARAFGSGEEAATLIKTATATNLLSAGWPRMTTTKSYTDVVDGTTLQRHANADLAASAGVATGYSLVTLDGEPDWTQIPRGSTVYVVLDTDMYGGVRPVQFTARLLDLVVRIPDSGVAQVEWRIADVLEV